jgi:hypothetical protein
MAFRAHSLDGAMLFFERASGVNVRVECAATAEMRRTAPRVVMFGITNACNLRCDFCSRDVGRASTWTATSAAEMLEGLAAAGTLEVAFGGGEPFAFRGFRALVQRLRSTTELALHVTTNGTLYEDLSLDMVRLSIYPGWRAAARKIRGRWGANVLVDDHNLDALPLLLIELAALGASDVSLLSYVGPDRDYDLRRDGLDSVIRASPIPCRVSVCFGDRVHPRLFGGDCGAGLDFVTLTSDRRLQACSFQDASVPVETADDVLAHWRRRAMSAPSPRVGCARSSKPSDTAGIRVWQGFSGNNSGECVLVARFQEIGAAERLLAELAPDYYPAQVYSAPWRELFDREHVAGPNVATGVSPDEMNVLGQTLVAITESSLGDDFPELRALAWKRDAVVAPARMHPWNTSTVLFAARATDVKHATEIAARLPVAIRHGDRVVGAFRLATLADAQIELARITGDRPTAVELFPQRIDARDLGHAVAAKPTAEKPRLAISFWNQPAALEAFAPETNATPTRDLILVDGLTRRKRMALRAFQRGAMVSALDGETIQIHASFWVKGARTKAPMESLQRAIDARLRGVVVKGSGATIETNDPVTVLTALDHAAREADLDASLRVTEVDPLAKAVARLLADV